MVWERSSVFETDASFNPETAAVTDLAGSIEELAERILGEYELLTAYPLIHNWQARNGALPVGTPLMPKIPFVLGGALAVNNLYALDAVRGMKSRGNLARQIKDLPDGAEIEFCIVD